MAIRTIIFRPYRRKGGAEMATKQRSFRFLAGLTFLIGCVVPAPTPLPPPPPGVEVINSPGETIHVDLTQLPGYSHSRGSTTLRFPLYKGAKWETTLSSGGGHGWTVKVEVTEITDEVINRERLRIARLKFTDNSPMSGGSSQMGECWYSPVKKNIVRCQ